MQDNNAHGEPPVSHAGGSKRVHFFRNGDPFYPPQKVIINSRNYRTFEALLEDLTAMTQIPMGVRNIYTPVNGTRIENLEGLLKDRYYVCAGGEKLKRLTYGLATALHMKRPGKAAPSYGQSLGDEREQAPQQQPQPVHAQSQLVL
eukprot:Colp12_sorted_trinity150504_noHs@11366